MNSLQYNKLVDKYADNVYRFILKSNQNEDDAKDIIQEAFERLWKNKKTIDYNKAKSYLFSTAYHIMIDEIRKEKRRKTINEIEKYTPEYNENPPDLSEILEQAIATLPEKQKHLILLRDYEGYSYKEISEIADLNENQVKVYIFRARKALKNYIGKIENVI